MKGTLDEKEHCNFQKSGCSRCSPPTQERILPIHILFVLAPQGTVFKYVILHGVRHVGPFLNT